MAARTIARFSKPEEAHLFRMRLGAAGITAYVQDEHLVQMDWFASNAIGGVRVQIAEEDLGVTREFLAEDKPAPPSKEAVEAACPFCGTTDIAVDDLPGQVGLFSVLMLHLPLCLPWRSWRCSSCQRVFRNAVEKPAESVALE